MSQSSDRCPVNVRSAPAPTRKFYVRSGKQRLVVLAIDAEIAALRFIHHVFQGMLISAAKPLSDQLQLLKPQSMKPMMDSMESEILISEAGFSRSEAGQFSTRLIVARWRLQIAALEEILRKANRRMAK